jgi:hypothetical protein
VFENGCSKLAVGVSASSLCAAPAGRSLPTTVSQPHASRAFLENPGSQVGPGGVCGELMARRMDA